MNLKSKQINYYKTFFSFLIIAALAVAIFWLTKTELFLLKQKEFNQILMSTIRKLRDGVTIESLFYISMLSILYGFFHAIGPGHGKLILSGFLFKNSNDYKKAIKVSLITTVTHVGSAVIISYLLKYIFTGVGHFARINMLDYFKTTSGVLIISIGIAVLFSSTIKKFLPNSKNSEAITNNIYLMGLLAGAVPCPLSMMIMLISISYSIELIGIILVTAIAFGILLFLLLFSLSFVLFKDTSTALTEKISLTLPFNIKFIQSGLYILIGCVLIFSN